MPHEEQEADQDLEPKPKEDLEEDEVVNVDSSRLSGGRKKSVTKVVDLTEHARNKKSIGKK